MKQFFTLLFVSLFCYTAKAQNSADFAVQLTATTQISPARITLHWLPLSDTNIYKIYKKTKTSLTWSSSIVTLHSSDSAYTDTTVIVDSAYEYFVAADHYIGGTYKWTATGYIYAGIKSPAMHSKGGLVVVVDSTYLDSCADGLHKLMKDISGDGWQIFRHNVSRSLKDTAVKRLIKDDYTNNANVKAVLLVGHVAVPYSGDLNPDGHPDHLGAWPADVYYADLTGTWTDASVNDTASPYSWTKNGIGDGKWDQTQIPALTALQVSRIDVYNMPGSTGTDIQLMTRYLAKDHIYKMDSLYMRHRGIISDNFGVFSSSAGYEAFASTAWRSFPPLLTRDSIAPTSALIANLDTATFQWAYGCGGGSFTSAGGIGNSADFAAADMNGIFTVLFGSYFGDWNVPNGFLRAPLCANVPALTSCWAGRPYWYFHHMALGENIGFAAWHSQNNDGNRYGPPSIYGIQDWVHIALLGDLTLRTDYIKPANNLTITHTTLHGANLTWTASADGSVLGYYVYRATSEFGNYQKISGMVSGLTFHDTVGSNGLKFYMVRPVKLQSTPSGAYYNLGIGITDSATVSFPISAVENTPIVTLNFELYPNPASNYINVAINAEAASTATLSVVNIKGDRFATATKQIQQGTNVFSLQVADLPAGMYTVQVTAGGNTTVKKWIKL